MDTEENVHGETCGVCKIRTHGAVPRMSISTGRNQKPGTQRRVQKRVMRLMEEKSAHQRRLVDTKKRKERYYEAAYKKKRKEKKKSKKRRI